MRNNYTKNECPDGGDTNNSGRILKIAMYGNVCNNLYALARALNSQPDIEAHLYLDQNGQFQFNPANEDSSLRQRRPRWIHESVEWNPFLTFKRLNFKFVKELEAYDIVILSDFGVMLASLLRRPRVVFYVTGMDLTRVPFFRRYSWDSGSIITYFKRMLISYAQRVGIKSCNFIIAAPFYPFTSSLKDLGVKDGCLCSSYYPILIDTEKFNKNESQTTGLGNIFPELEKFEFVVLHPSRIITKTSNDFRESGHYKGNEILLRGFADWVHSGGGHGACLAVIDRAHNIEVQNFKKLIIDLNINKHVVWLQPPTSEGFKREDLISLYKMSHVVVDDFGAGWFGSIVVEACAMELPVLCYVDSEVMNRLYPWHPILSVKSPLEISNILQRLYKDCDYRRSVSRASREWALKFHSINNLGDVYVRNMRRDGILTWSKGRSMTGW